jgi:hypothetical protein
LRSDELSELASKFADDLHSQGYYTNPVLQGVYIDPLVGVISAYLYDSIGDIDSIRQMAFYYAKAQQAIPYDIALLASLKGVNIAEMVSRE